MRDIDKIITSYKGVAKEVKDELARDILSDGFDNEAQALEFAEEVEQIAEWLTELQERREADRWISVKERMPEPRVAVMVYCPQYKNQYCAFYDGTHWRVFGTRNTDEVTYWKPLSQVPEESEDK